MTDDDIDTFLDYTWCNSETCSHCNKEEVKDDVEDITPRFKNIRLPPGVNGDDEVKGPAIKFSLIKIGGSHPFKCISEYNYFTEQCLNMDETEALQRTIDKFVVT